MQNRGNLSLALVIEDLAQTQVGEVLPGGRFSGMHSPAFTPDKSRVFFRYPEEARQQIYSVNLKGEDRRTVIDSEGVNNWPRISPDGRQLVFSSSRDNVYEIYMADINGSNPRRLTNSPRQEPRPSKMAVEARPASQRGCALPIGIPKLMVSTMASGNTAPDVDCSDLCLMPSVVDVAGLNTVSRRVLSNSAHAMALVDEFLRLWAMRRT